MSKKVKKKEFLSNDFTWNQQQHLASRFVYTFLWSHIAYDVKSFFSLMGTTPKKEFYSSFYRPIDIKMTRNKLAVNMRNIYPLFTILVSVVVLFPFIYRYTGWRGTDESKTISVHCHVHKNIYKLFIAVSFLMGANFFFFSRAICLLVFPILPSI